MTFNERVFTLLGACLCTTAAGVIYGFSLYGPQLMKQLVFTSTQINLVGASGNVGHFLGNPISGYLTTFISSKKLLTIGALLMFIGFFSMKLMFDFTYSDYRLYMFSYFLVGLGSSISTMVPLAITSINFRDHQGFATGLPLVLFGFSALMYSVICHQFFVKEKQINLSFFIGFLGAFSTVLILVGLLLLKKLPTNNQTQIITDNETINNDNDSPETNAHLDENETTHLVNNANTSALSLNTCTGKDMLFQPKSILLFVIMFGITGSGIMYGNNVGEILHVINVKYPLSNLPRLQSINVSLYSISNTIGRLVVTLSSDKMKHKFNIKRTNYLIGSILIMIMSHICLILSGLDRNIMQMICLCSILTGASYGILFATCPAIVSEMFGRKKFAQNWGLFSLAPAFSSQIFNTVFGIIYDKQKTIEDINNKVCSSGKNCYVEQFYIAGIVSLCCLFMCFSFNKFNK